MNHGYEDEEGTSPPHIPPLADPLLLPDDLDNSPFARAGPSGLLAHLMGGNMGMGMGMGRYMRTPPPK